jgi:hypothetical protein
VITVFFDTANHHFTIATPEGHHAVPRGGDPEDFASMYAAGRPITYVREV